MTSRIGFGRMLAMPFDEAIARVTDALRKEGFGVLSDIDVARTLKTRLNVDFAPYRILGACNPPLAHRALELEPEIGLLLPCNVVVRQENGGVRIDFMDPTAVLDLVDRPEIHDVAADVKKRLERVCGALG